MSDTFRRTGVFASAKEIKALKRSTKRAADTPVISFGGRRPSSLADDAWREVQQSTHKYALAHGLPEIPGYYGCDLETGEFIKALK